MQRVIRPVIVGLFLGFISVLFGISWAMYLAVNHSEIDRTLADRAMTAFADKFVISGRDAESLTHGHGHGDMNMTGSRVNAGAKEGHGMNGMDEEKVKSAENPKEKPWEDSTIDKAKNRLIKGHLHATGLGTMTIVISFLIAFLGAPAGVKTLASACLGVGGLFYPISWIIMGYRTPALGVEAAQKSVFPIASFSILLVLIGIIITLFYLIKGAIKGD